MFNKDGLHEWPGASVCEADFDELFGLKLWRIYNYFRYRVGDGPVVEDLMSKTFETAWRNRECRRRNLDAFSAWLFTIARWVA